MIDGMINAAFKVAFHLARPYWYSGDIKVYVSPENSFGLPSGHSQNAVVIWGALAAWIKNRWAWVIAIFLMFMIGLSRIYLALHFPVDVLMGWIIGVVILWLLLRLENPVVRWLNNYSMAIQIAIAFGFSLFLILLVVIAQLTLSGWSLPVEWITNARLAYPSEPAINPLSFHNFLSNPGAFFGLAAGWIWTVKNGGFSARGSGWKLLLRYTAGLIGVLILYAGLDAIFPETETLIAYTLRYIRYALIGFWISGFAPWLFIKLKIASHA